VNAQSQRVPSLSSFVSQRAHSPWQTYLGAERSSAPGHPTVIAFASGKGGVGKTSLAVNVAVSMARKGARVLCMDADLGLGNVDLLLGMSPARNVGHVLAGEAGIEEIVLESPHGVHLLPASAGQFDLCNLDDRKRRQLCAAVDTLEDRFDVLIVDTGAGLTSNAVWFASAARHVVLVTTPEPTCVMDVLANVKILARTFAVRRAHVVSNMVSSPDEGQDVFLRLSSQVSRCTDVVLDYLGAIPTDAAVGRAVMRGEPVVSCYPDSLAARAVERLADQVWHSPEPDDRHGAIRLFWKKLLQQRDSP